MTVSSELPNEGDVGGNEDRGSSKLQYSGEGVDLMVSDSASRRSLNVPPKEATLPSVKYKVIQESEGSQRDIKEIKERQAGDPTVAQGKQVKSRQQRPMQSAEIRLEEPRVCFGSSEDHQRRAGEAARRERGEWEMTGRVNIEARQQVDDVEGQANVVVHQRRRRISQQSNEDKETCADTCCCYIIWVFAAVIAMVVMLVCLHFMTSII